MPRPREKKGVTVEMRRKWLRRVEEDGESIAELVRETGYDSRTVKKHLDEAREERESREARLAVVRDSLRDHFDDLLKVARTIQSEVSRNNSIYHLAEDRVYSALQQHLAKSALWKLLDNWEKSQATLVKSRENLKAGIDKDLKTRRDLAEAFVGGSPDYDSMVRFFTEQAEFWKAGGKGLSIDENFRVEPAGNDMSIVKVGGYTLGQAPVSQSHAIKKALASYRSTFNDLPEFESLKQADADLMRQAPDIDETLAVIILRRFIPGRCKYCPVQ